MDNQNKNKIIIALLIVIIIILSVFCILFATGTISLKNTTTDNNELNQNVPATKPSENDTQIANISLANIKEIFKFVYDYRELPFVYCGEQDSVTPSNGEMAKYYVSTEFSTYDDMINYLKKYMSIEVISNTTFPATNQNLYKEENGKLYCEMTYKGYPYGRGNIEIEITSQNENKVNCIATMELTDPGENKIYDKVNIVLEKNEDNWIITSYSK